jgi:hypothetical protein
LLTVVLSPEGERGVAVLAQQRKGQENALWTYLPTVRRARAVMPLDAHQSFLGTDFTYADLGFLDVRARQKLVGTVQQDGVETYKIESVPHDQRHYSRILTWVATDSSLPVRREFYDPAGALWKVQTFPDISRVDGVPTILRMKMDNVGEGGSTDIHVDDVHYGSDVPDDLFDPANLPAAATSPIWSAMGH